MVSHVIGVGIDKKRGGAGGGERLRMTRFKGCGSMRVGKSRRKMRDRGGSTEQPQGHQRISSSADLFPIPGGELEGNIPQRLLCVTKGQGEGEHYDCGLGLMESSRGAKCLC